MRALVAAVLVMSVFSGCFGGEEGGPDQHSADDPGFAVGFSDTHVFAGDYDTSGRFSRTLEEGPFGVLEPEVVHLASEVDGEPIEMEVYRPDVPEGTRVPVILMASPYTDDDLSPDEIVGGNTYAEDHHYGQPLLLNYPPHGYALAFMAVRGSGGSGGCMEMFGPREQADVDQAITWLGEQGWSNGNVGMIGISYDGATAWEAAAQGNPYLKTIVPAAGVNDVFGMVHRNGTWAASASAPLAFFTFSNTLYSVDPPAMMDARHLLTRTACPEVSESLAPIVTGALLGERDAADFWGVRNHRPGVEANYDGSIFLIHGFHDLNVPVHASYPWVNQLEDDGVVVKHLVGQWRHVFPDVPSADATSPVHNPTPRYDLAEMLLHWFDRWLKEDENVDLGPVAQVADNTGAWRSETAWPPDDAVSQTWYLTPDGGLERSEPDSTGSMLVGTHAADLLLPKDLPLTGPEDPCPTCAVFLTPTLEEDLRFAGAPLPHLVVTPTGPGGYLTAALYAIDDMGAAALLTDGAMDLRFARGGEQPEPVVPGESLTTYMALDSVDAVVPAGGRMALVVSQARARDDGPILTQELYMTLPNAPPTPVLLELGPDLSTLTLRTFERDDTVFFQPPGVAP